MAFDMATLLPAGLLVEKASLLAPASPAPSPGLSSAAKTLGFQIIISCKPGSAYELREILSIKGGREIPTLPQFPPPLIRASALHSV